MDSCLLLSDYWDEFRIQFVKKFPVKNVFGLENQMDMEMYPVCLLIKIIWLKKSQMKLLK